MHRLPNQSTVRRFRAAALLVLLKWLLFTISVPMLGYAIMVEKQDLGYLAVALLCAAGLVSISHWLVALRARCPLCFVPSFSHRQQAKSRRARRFLGSYRFFVALSVIFKGYFHCPYCGEETAIEARQNSRR